MDSVRAKSTTIGGHVVDTTPFLSEFAERSTQYSHAKSPGAKSLTSHVSIFTGFEVEEHNITSAADRLAPGNSIFEQLSNRGYETGVFSENTWLTDVEVGLKDGFDTIEGPRNLPFPDKLDPKAFVASEGQGEYSAFLRACLQSGSPVKSLANGVATKIAWDYPHLLPQRFKTSTPANVYADKFLEWEENQANPWAACINFMDAHIPYEPDATHDQWGGPEARKIQQNLDDLEWVFLGGQEPWWKRRALEGLYEGAIHQMDSEIRHLIEVLEARGTLENTLVVITSDHGEGFGEKDEIRDTRIAEHGVSINEEVVHVPLIVKYPEQTKGEIVTKPATLTKFTSLVESTIEGESDPGAVVPDEGVRVSAVGLTESLIDRAGNYVEDLNPYTSTARAFYQHEADGIQKYISWNSRYQDRVIHSSQINYATESARARDKIQSSFRDISDAGLRERGQTQSEMDKTTRGRLEELGYL